MAALHDAVVIEHREKCGDKNYRGQNLEGKDKTKLAALFAQLAEHHLRAGEGVLQELVDAMACPFQQIPAKGKTQHEDGEQELQDESHDYGLDPDRPAIAGKQVGEAEHGDQT